MNGHLNFSTSSYGGTCMTPSNQRLIAAASDQLQAQLALTTALTSTLLASTEKLAGLNLQAGKASLDASLNQWRQFMSMPQSTPSTAAGGRHTDIAALYFKHLGGIASAAQSEAFDAVEAQLNRTSRQWIRLLDDLADTSPGGSDTMLAMMKSAIDNVSSGFAQLNKSARVAQNALRPDAMAAGAASSRNSRTAGRGLH